MVVSFFFKNFPQYHNITYHLEDLENAARDTCKGNQTVSSSQQVTHKGTVDSFFFTLPTSENPDRSYIIQFYCHIANRRSDII